MDYEIFEYRFYDRKNKLAFLIYARSEETANRLIAIENENNIVHFKKPIFRKFKVACTTQKPPLEIENEQEEILEQRKAHRVDYLKTHKGVI